jgi:energy-coupling factor transport system permease protein
MVYIALRFIPVLSGEARSIRAAQLSRGLVPGKGAVSRIRSSIPLLLPLFLGAIRRAEHLALAIESRGYRKGVLRTSLTSHRLGRADAVFAALAIIVFSAILLADRMITL